MRQGKNAKHSVNAGKDLADLCKRAMNDGDKDSNPELVPHIKYSVKQYLYSNSDEVLEYALYKLKDNPEIALSFEEILEFESEQAPIFSTTGKFLGYVQLFAIPMVVQCTQENSIPSLGKKQVNLVEKILRQNDLLGLKKSVALFPQLYSLEDMENIPYSLRRRLTDCGFNYMQDPSPLNFTTIKQMLPAPSGMEPSSHSCLRYLVGIYTSVVNEAVSSRMPDPDDKWCMRLSNTLSTAKHTFRISNPVGFGQALRDGIDLMNLELERAAQLFLNAAPAEPRFVEIREYTKKVAVITLFGENGGVFTQFSVPMFRRNGYSFSHWRDEWELIFEECNAQLLPERPQHLH